MKKLSEVWASFKALRQKYHAGELKDKPGFPKYRKRKGGTRPADFIPIKTARSYLLSARQLALTLPGDLKTKSRLLIAIRGLKRYLGKEGCPDDVHYDRMG